MKVMDHFSTFISSPLGLKAKKGPSCKQELLFLLLHFSRGSDWHLLGWIDAGIRLAAYNHAWKPRQKEAAFLKLCSRGR